MRGRRRIGIGIGWLVAGLLAAAPASAAVPVAAIHRIVAVGDLHGDFGAWRDIALAAHLVDPGGRWTGGDTVFVQTGDVVDRGPDSLRIIEDLMRLQHEAPHAGGRVVTLVGNHEAMNVTDDLRYVSPSDYAAFATPGSADLRDRVYADNQVAIDAAYRRTDPGMSDAAIRQAWLAATPLGMIEHQAAWHPNGRIGRWVIGNPAMVLIDGTLFVHGGLSAGYAAMPIAEINRRVAAALQAHDTAPTAIINDSVGPLWYRGLAMRTDDDEASATTSKAPTAPARSIEDELTQVLAATGARRMVIAHTPDLSGVAILYGGRLIRIDTGISAYYGGPLTYLEIIDGKVVPHVVQRSTPSKAGAG